MMVMTVFVLFGDNIKLMACEPGYDSGFDICNSICFFFFIYELLASSWIKRDYIGTLFWWLDIVSIVSMIFDVGFISKNSAIGDISSSVGSSGSSVYTKAARVVRLVRLVRLFRLYKLAIERRRQEEEEREILELAKLGLADYEELKLQVTLNRSRQSKLGSSLSNIMTQRIIITVLFMVILMPLLIYVTYDNGASITSQILHAVNCDASIPAYLKKAFIDQVVDYVDTNDENRVPTSTAVNRYLIDATLTPFSDSYSTFNGRYVDHYQTLDSLRSAAKDTYEYHSTMTTGATCHTEIIFNKNPVLQLTALYAIIMTIFIAIMLVLTAVILADDAQKLVLTPLDKMMNMVEAVAMNPLQKATFIRNDEDIADKHETDLLEKTIEKITSLLRVGFGEAGAKIISANLSLENSGSSTINPLLPGVKAYCIVGFCDIHHFDDCLLALNKDILIFVNTIAEVVHHNVTKWGGQCNKNLGNAFVIVWRIPDESVDDVTSLRSVKMSRKGPQKRDSAKSSREVDMKRIPGVDVLADQALIGYLKIIAELNRSKGILAYRKEPRLTQSGAQEFKVRMGFGLHAGWAIEGAVGSIYKVDATYLSPHVNMAARLETSSRQYGVPLLASHFFHELMSREAQSYCRRLDVVTVKGSEVPISIFTYDCLQEQVFPVPKAQGSSPTKLSSKTTKLSAKVLSKALNTSSGSFDTLDEVEPSDAVLRRGDFYNETDPTSDVFANDADMLALRSHVTPEFLASFEAAVNLYLDGAWPAAKLALEAVDKLMRAICPQLREDGDKPCLTLLRYMAERGNKAPADWAGYRPLTAK